mgnify:FL=1
MTDLFASMNEHALEREAIMADSGINDREALQADLHRCEVQSVIRRYFPDGDPKPFFADVEKFRGKVAADKLRAGCRAAWAEVKAAGGVKKK